MDMAKRAQMVGVYEPANRAYVTVSVPFMPEAS